MPSANSPGGIAAGDQQSAQHPHRRHGQTPQGQGLSQCVWCIMVSAGCEQTQSGEYALIQRLVITSHQTFKVHSFTYIESSIVRGNKATFVPWKYKNILQGTKSAFVTLIIE